MTEQDIKNIEAVIDNAHASTSSIISSQSLLDIIEHRRVLGDAETACDSIITFLDGVVKKYQNKRDEFRDKKRMLSRDDETMKQSYWMIKNEMDRTHLPS